MQLHHAGVVREVEVVGGVDRDDTGHGARVARVDAPDLRVRHRRPHEREVQRAGEGEVVDVGAFAPEQRRVLDPPHGDADQRAGSERGGGHRAVPATVASRATHEHPRQVAAVLGRRVEVGRRIGALVGGGRGVGRRRAGPQRGLDRGGPDGGGTHVHQRHAGGVTTHRGDADDGPVLGAPVELLERPARAVGLRHPDLGDDLVGGERGLEEVEEEVVGVDHTFTTTPPDDDAAPEREDHRGQVRRGVAVRQRPAEGAAVADLRVADLARGRAQDRDVLPHHRVVLDVVVPGEPTDGELVAVVAHVREVAEPADVDQHRRRRQPQLHQWQQRVPAGEELGVVAVLGQQRDRLVDRVGAGRRRTRRDHRSPAISAEPATTAATMLW